MTGYTQPSYTDSMILLGMFAVLLALLGIFSAIRISPFVAIVMWVMACLGHLYDMMGISWIKCRNWYSQKYSRRSTYARGETCIFSH